MNVKELFTGIAVVVDDDVDNPSAGITDIIECIEDRFDITCLKLSTRPRCESVKSLSEVTMIILDWILDPLIEPADGNLLSVQPGSALERANAEDNIKLIKTVLEETLVPIFIVTDNPKEAREVLEKNEISVVDGRVSVMGKRDLRKTTALENKLEGWLTHNRETYVLKEWENTAKNAKVDFFRAFGKEEAKWADILWARIKKDDESDCVNMFGEYLTRCVVNRMDDFTFDSTVFEEGYEITADSGKIISSLVNAEKLKKLDSFPDHPRAGDLYYCHNEENKSYRFLLNIRADCDTTRAKHPIVYCIKGQSVFAEDLKSARSVIVKDDQSYLCLRGQKKQVSDLKENGFKEVDETLALEQIPLKQLHEIIVDSPLNIDFLNRRLETEPPVTNVYGKLRSPGSMYYLPLKMENKDDTARAGKEIVAIKFRLELSTMKYESIKGKGEGKDKTEYKYYGRLLSPYINEIQQECAKWCFRIGAMPVPDEFFALGGIVDEDC